MGTFYQTIWLPPGADPVSFFDVVVKPRGSDGDLVDIVANRQEDASTGKETGPLTGWTLVYEYDGIEIDGPFEWPRSSDGGERCHNAFTKQRPAIGESRKLTASRRKAEILLAAGFTPSQVKAMALVFQDRIKESDLTDDDPKWYMGEGRYQ